MTVHIASSFSFCQNVANENEEECQEEQYFLCPHCNLWLCIPHNLEHQQIIQTSAHEFNDRVNQVRQQLTDISIDYIYEDCNKKIDDWRDQMLAEIKNRHSEMFQHLNKLYNELTEEIKEFKEKKIELFTHEFIEPLAHMLTKQKQVHPEKLKALVAQLKSLEEKIELIKIPDLIQMNLDEIKLNGKINFTRQHPCDEIDATLNRRQLLELDCVNQKEYHRFSLKKNSKALAASSNFILAFESPSTLLLFDKKSPLRSIDTKGNKVWDICWSEAMKIFLIAGKKLQIYDIIHDELADTSIENPHNGSDIWSVTSYLHDVLLLDNDGFIKRYSCPSFKLKASWPEKVYLRENNDTGAAQIRLNNIGILAISIKQEDLHWRIDLFDVQMQRIHRGIPLTNNGTADLWDIPFISLNNNEWLVMDLRSMPQMLLLVDENGKIQQQVERGGSNVALMGRTYLVLRDSTGLQLYKVSQES
ncbi:unnamed protein product [Rotaria socialis]|uniref:Uncharacterized protein n=1 Tax=Rotaria socialis TaxID=392032 RepID=A0A820ZQU6_9BILA|nr:unnamed protein product [Rotaria socialis]CAF3728923.1 unnamed protein product [Rotaria socialis]CAF4453914.1 unnamed protein product [Rotaria socialis]CAF4566836.1 unnamed protein product [Rotaria socialis]